MIFYRKTIENVPSVISIPTELRNRNIGIIILTFRQNQKRRAKNRAGQKPLSDCLL